MLYTVLIYLHSQSPSWNPATLPTGQRSECILCIADISSKLTTEVHGFSSRARLNLSLRESILRRYRLQQYNMHATYNFLPLQVTT